MCTSCQSVMAWAAWMSQGVAIYCACLTRMSCALWVRFDQTSLAADRVSGSWHSNKAESYKNIELPATPCCCLFGFNVAFIFFFSHITTVSGCDRELNASLLTYHAPGETEWISTIKASLIRYHFLNRPSTCFPGEKWGTHPESETPTLHCK